ncbi:hypothetical protein CHS0354_027550 [Potamilus streckersoni]|uniref:Uncharacterized protein n=1 Tax=Potamilus streckersoni TaxID=2493646 RepID=A0AAE0S0W4_9BIVA|nr:hypothetical protein CHS0354_027550 [Potamilus streckersoni]
MSCWNNINPDDHNPKSTTLNDLPIKCVQTCNFMNFALFDFEARDFAVQLISDWRSARGDMMTSHFRNTFSASNLMSANRSFCDVWCKNQEMGLKTVYDMRGLEYRYIRSLMALPFLPAADMPPVVLDLPEPRANSTDLHLLHLAGQPRVASPQVECFPTKHQNK